MRLLAVCVLLWASLADGSGWSGPRVRLVKGDGLPHFHLEHANSSNSTVPALWVVGGPPSLYGPKEPRYVPALPRLYREVNTAGSVAGVHVVSAVVTWAGYAGSSSILPNGTLAPGVLDFLRALLTHAGPSSLLIVRVRLDLKPPSSGPPAGYTRPGAVQLESTLNGSKLLTDRLASPTQKWSTMMGSLVAKVMVTIDAAFPGRVLGAQILHGVTYEGNFPSSWSAASVEGLPAGMYNHYWPDYSPEAIVEFCGGVQEDGACVVPTAAQRDTPTLGSTLLTADTPAGAASIGLNRYMNVAMAEGIAAVGAALHLASGGKAFTCTLYGGIFNGASVATASGGSALTELNLQPGIDGIGNPPTYLAASRSDSGTMQPQAPWDSPGMHGKVYVIEYDLRTYLTVGGNYDFLTTLNETADLILHDLAAAAIRGHALYILDPKASDFVAPNASGSDAGGAGAGGGGGTTAIWEAVHRAMTTAAKLERHAAGGLVAEVGVFVDDLSTAHWPIGLGVFGASCGSPPPPPPSPGAGAAGRGGATQSRDHQQSRGCLSWTALTLGLIPGTFGALPFPVRYYLLSDLLVGDFSALKFAILINPVRVSTPLAAAIKAKLQCGGRTVMYFDAVAVVDGEGKHSPEGAQALTGLTGLTQGSLSSSSSSSMAQPTTRMTKFIDAVSVTPSWPAAAAAVWAPLVATGKTYGSTWPATPYWWLNTSAGAASAADGGATTTTVLGHFDGTDLPSLVQVQRADHTAVYSSNPGLPTEAFLALALAAGVHSYTPVVSSTTRVEAGGNLLVVHRKGATATTSGDCQVRLPRAMVVRDATDGGSLVCAKCVQFDDCRLGSETRVYTVA